MIFSKHWKKLARVFQSLEKSVLLGVLAVAIGHANFAAARSTLLSADEFAHLTNALAQLDMTTVDLGFEKDVGKPEWVVERNRRVLYEPLLLPDYGADLLGAATNGAEAVWDWVARAAESRFESAASSEFDEHGVGPSLEGLDAGLRAALIDFLRAAARARAGLDFAWADIARDEKEYAIAAHLCDFLRVEDFPDRRAGVEDLGVSRDAIEKVLREGEDIYPEPEARAYLAIARKSRMSFLLAAGRDLYEATVQLAERARQVVAWPPSVFRAVTPVGMVVIGTTRADFFDESATLILDPGGDDVYSGPAGVANGLRGTPLSVVLDLSGNDRYRSEAFMGAGAALFGICGVRDEQGDDVYESAGGGQGAVLFGVAWLHDGGGDDTYRAGVLAQGAAWNGVGVLWDDAGNDRYNVGLAGQGYAGVQGAGLLQDVTGNDVYVAGGREPDFERNDDRFVSLAQGFAIGMRPFAGGGTGALVDLAGNDTYVADVYGQGVSYWYSVGMLLDAGGNDRYTVHQYGQGTGIHLSAGLLADLGGDDSYTGAILVQGSAHDYAVGMLIEKSGRDVYVGRQHAQGRALNTALATLLDGAGDDSYFAHPCDECQGIGNDGDQREYGSLALLLDLRGRDFYTCGGREGKPVKRPNFGVIYDAKTEASP